MKRSHFLLIVALLTLLSCSNKDEPSSSTATPSAPAAPASTTAKGGVLFWTSNLIELQTCGVLTVHLSNGQQSSIAGYYFSAPANCVNQVGGYFYLDAGSYTYTVSTAGGCSMAGGTISVTGNQCNLFRIQ